MKEYKIKINSKNKMIPIKGRLIRSPVEFEIPESQLSYYKTLIQARRIDDYTIKEFDGIENKIIKTKTVSKKSKKRKNIIRENKKDSLLNKYID